MANLTSSGALTFYLDKLVDIHGMDGVTAALSEIARAHAERFRSKSWDRVVDSLSCAVDAAEEAYYLD